MPSPMDAIISRTKFSCTLCGAAMGTCNCWTRIRLECPDCKSVKRTYQDGSDPPGTALVVARCPDCDDSGKYPDILYFDASGKQIKETEKIEAAP
jgi:formate dehydrogenase maturation protein FdhE